MATPQDEVAPAAGCPVDRRKQRPASTALVKPPGGATPRYTAEHLRPRVRRYACDRGQEHRHRQRCDRRIQRDHRRLFDPHLTEEVGIGLALRFASQIPADMVRRKNAVPAHETAKTWRE